MRSTSAASPSVSNAGSNGSERPPNDDINHQKYTDVIHPATPIFAGVPDDPDQKTSTDTGGHQRTQNGRSTVTKVTYGRDCTGIHDTAAVVVNPNCLPKPGPTHGPSQGWENRGPHGRIATRLCDVAVGPQSVTLGDDAAVIMRADIGRSREGGATCASRPAPAYAEGQADSRPDRECRSPMGFLATRSIRTRAFVAPKRARR